MRPFANRPFYTAFIIFLVIFIISDIITIFNYKRKIRRTKLKLENIDTYTFRGYQMFYVQKVDRRKVSSLHLDIISADGNYVYKNYKCDSTYDKFLGKGDPFYSESIYYSDLFNELIFEKDLFADDLKKAISDYKYSMRLEIVFVIIAILILLYFLFT